MDYYGINLPDATSADEKAMMWSQQAHQYGTDSGYSTTAPSISSIDAFLNNEQQQDANWNNSNNHHQQQQQFASKLEPIVEMNVTTAAPQTTTEPAAAAKIATNEPDYNDNAVANWINNQDSGELASKAIPDMVKLICDEDLVVIKETAVLFYNMSRVEASRMAIIQTPGTVECLVNCLMTIADLDLVKILVGTLYSISTQKPLGVQSIINSNALDPLVKLLSVPAEAIVSYAITAIHNVLLDCNDNVKNFLRKIGAIQFIVPLLNSSPNVKLLSVVVDCLQLLAFQHSESKLAILQYGGLQMLIVILQHSDYHKLLLNTTRLLKVLSCCNQNKQALVGLNAVQLLTANLNTNNYDILTNVLVTLRNLSDAAIKLNGLDTLVKSLLGFLSSSKDLTILTTAAGALSNLTCNNENNKRAAVNSNAVQIIINLIRTNIMHFKLVDPCLCTLKHITNKHQDALLAQEQFRSINGLAVISNLMSIEPRNWMVIKAALVLIRNFCSNQQNANQIRANNLIEKLMQVLFESYTQIQIHGQVVMNDIKLSEIIDSISAALMILAKDPQNQLLMKQLDCIPFFVQMLFTHTPNIRKAAAILLAELATSSECALHIEQQPGLLQFVQENFYNQFGQLKTIAELSSANNNNNGASQQHSTVILQHISTMMQRLHDHRQQLLLIQQQKQQQQIVINNQHAAALHYSQPAASSRTAPVDFVAMQGQGHMAPNNNIIQHQQQQTNQQMIYYQQHQSQQFQQQQSPQFY